MDGPRGLGDKLNHMFNAARGSYVVALDDDDYLADGYCDYVLPSLVDGYLDFLGYDIVWMEDGALQGIVVHDLIGDPYWGTRVRGVSPKCPVRTTVASSVPFGNHYTADRDWSVAVHGKCVSGSYIPRSLYYYDHWNGHMVGTDPTDVRATRPQRDVGLWPYDAEVVTWL